MVGLPGEKMNTSSYYRTSVTKKCCAPGRIDCAPGLKYLDNAVSCVKIQMLKMTRSRSPIFSIIYHLYLVTISSNLAIKVTINEIPNLHLGLRIVGGESGKYPSFLFTYILL